MVWSALSAASIAVAFLAPCIFCGAVPTQRDFVNTFLTYKMYAARQIAEGRLPLWSHEAGFGAPFLANYQSSVLYPLAAIVYAAPTAAGIGLYLAANLWVAGFGTSLWLGRRGFSLPSRLLGAAVMMVGGVTVSIMPWSHLPVMVWIPFALIAAERLVEAPSAPRFAALTAVLVIQVLGGAPETYAQSCAILAGTALLAARRSRRSWLGLSLVAAAGVFSLTLCAIQLAPTAEYYSMTERATGLGRVEGMSESMMPQTFSTLLFPHQVHDGVLETPIEHRMPLFWSIYLGIAPLCLVPIGLASRRGLGWGAVAVVGFVLALGDNTPVYPWLYELVPRLFAAFRYPQKFLITAHVALVVLAACGMERLLSTLGERKRRARSLLAAGLIAFTVADLVEVHAPAMLYMNWRRMLASPAPEFFSLGSQARLFLYQRAETGLLKWLPRFLFEADWLKRQEVLWASLSGNISLVYGIRFVNNGDSFTSGIPALKEFYRALRNAPVDRAVHALRAMNVGLLSGEKPLESPELVRLREGNEEQTWIYRVVDPAPRVYLARRVLPVASVKEAMAALVEPTFVPGEDAAVEGERIAAGERASGRAVLVSESPSEIVIEAEAAGRALVVDTDSFFPGWIADVDGADTPILRANGLVRAVEVEPGRHVVRFRYQAPAFWRGVRISLASLAVFGAMLLLLRRIRADGR